MDKVFYNQSSAERLGWKPNWFGVEHNDEQLIEAVKAWQKQYDLTQDGLVGPMTYRRIWTERQASISDYRPNSAVYDSSDNACADQKYIVHNNKFFPIDWHKVVLWDEPSGLKINPGGYYDNAGKKERKPIVFVNHWDVCLSAESCAQILNKKKISVHFCIDNDGTIYQTLDTQHGGWHAGNYQGNKNGIGVEISNAYYTKYQDWYVENGFGERPLMENAQVHGKTLTPFLWFYPAQIAALKALWKAVHLGLGIPLDCPLDANGELLLGVHEPSVKGKFHGFNNHYNYTTNKRDCAGLDLLTLLDEVKIEIE